MYNELKFLFLVYRSRAVRRRHCVGGGAPVNFGRRRRRAAGPTKSAAARRGRPKFFSRIHDKISFYPQNILMNFFSHQSFEVCRLPMIAGSESDLQRMMDRLNMVSVNYNMKINTKKTKVLRVSKGSGSKNFN